MKENTSSRQWHGEEEKWSPDDLKSFANRVEQAKEQSGCSLSSTMEILEILEQLQGMHLDFPLPQQRYFGEVADELIGLAISHLERMRTELKFR